MQSWRKTILDSLADEGEVAADSLHEGADGPQELEEALAAADALVTEGLAVLDAHEVYVVAPGREADVRRAAREAV